MQKYQHPAARRDNGWARMPVFQLSVDKEIAFTYYLAALDERVRAEAFGDLW